MVSGLSSSSETVNGSAGAVPKKLVRATAKPGFQIQTSNSAGSSELCSSADGSGAKVNRPSAPACVCAKIVEPARSKSDFSCRVSQTVAPATGAPWASSARPQMVCVAGAVGCAGIVATRAAGGRSTCGGSLRRECSHDQPTTATTNATTDRGMRDPLIDRPPAFNARAVIYEKYGILETRVTSRGPKTTAKGRPRTPRGSGIVDGRGPS